LLLLVMIIGSQAYFFIIVQMTTPILQSIFLNSSFDVFIRVCFGNYSILIPKDSTKSFFQNHLKAVYFQIVKYNCFVESIFQKFDKWMLFTTIKLESPPIFKEYIMANFEIYIIKIQF